jgi:catechol 2,3-dioxygenase-like lactoylglutathione lyase family enzyme
MNLNQITISVSDIKRSIEFYTNLGLKLIVKADHYCRFIVPGNDVTFSIQLSDKVMPGSTIIYFECNDLDKKVQESKSKAITFSHDARDQIWLWREAYLNDPDGHVICLYFAGDARLNPPWRIKS